jgi:tripartite-type tricarboxylate transporter receptor subunit TctC
MLRSLGVLLAILLTSTGSEAAQNWPSRSITLLVPFPAGGPTDVLARTVAEAMSSRLGQPMVVQNITGAFGSIAMQKLANSDADGYTIAMGSTGTQTTAPQIAKVPYDPFHDFTPISLIVTHQMAVVVNKSSSFRSVADLIAYAKDHPDEVTYGDAGTGTMNQLASLLLGRVSGVKFRAIGYRGASPATIDLIAGRINFYIDILGSAAEFVRNDQLRMLAVTGADRSSLFPQVPTVGETFPGYEIRGWFALFGPKDLPPEIAAKLNMAARSAVEDPKMATFIKTYGYDAAPSTASELQFTVESDFKRWTEVLKDRIEQGNN